jgi:hypothetical protein
MKKAVFIIGVLLLASCSKPEEIVPQPAKDCNCGLILSDNVQDYSVVVRNQCSGKEKKFILTPGDWINAHVGSNICFSNVKTWRKWEN